ncbi:hypothetical protein HHL21_12125 [Massilia sp. RP-1-19]|uniref:Uncharacterized protein n=1 Tax=Massilia polaris TaxID=2728846 RepID=A0A848HL85_9BURK|nr:hypothetical protein [Massilia polaris]NML61807.1 hypothetical protein [Massilia polaris]
MNEESKPKNAGTIELALELKGVSFALVGLDQIKFAAQEAAAAVASIGAPAAVSVQGVELVAGETPALMLAEWRRTNELLTSFMWYVENGLLTRGH